MTAKSRKRLGMAAAVLAGTLVLGGGRPAQAQNNTYQDFPFNQGSLFYQYRPYKSNGTKAAAPRPAPRAGWFRRGTPTYRSPYATTPAPRTVYTQPPQVYYVTPATRPPVAAAPPR